MQPPDILWGIIRPDNGQFIPKHDLVRLSRLEDVWCVWLDDNVPIEIRRLVIAFGISLDSPFIGHAPYFVGVI
jgi:hypothetical protein